MNQEKKKEIKAAIDATLNVLGLKGKLKYTLSVDNHSSLIMKIKSSPIDFIGNYNALAEEKNKFITDHMKNMIADGNININPYWAHEHFTGEPRTVIVAILKAVNVLNWDKSDIQSDYFNVGYHISVNIGMWDKPYIVK